MRQWVRALAEGRLDEAASFAKPDCAWWVQGMGIFDVPTVRGFWSGPFSSAAGPEALTVLSLTAEDDRLAVEIESDINFPDGRDYRNTYCFVFTFSDGRFARVREYFDTAYTQSLFGTP